ncbi:MAG: DUF1080 domain-containing protein [Planctomycetes bacterium]|nr:DUF1080 domain-containing protein [Planctomycetota bacterium]
MHRAALVLLMSLALVGSPAMAAQNPPKDETTAEEDQPQEKEQSPKQPEKEEPQKEEPQKEEPPKTEDQPQDEKPGKEESQKKEQPQKQPEKEEPQQDAKPRKQEPPKKKEEPRKQPRKEEQPRKADPKTAFTDRADAGIDFAYQGEYGGFLGPWGYGREVGVQVIARGDGNFDGVLYLGGLPGAGWDGTPRRELSGALEAGVLTLSGDDRHVVIAPGGAATYDAQGRRLGNLVKRRRVSPTLGAAPPPGAKVLFNGSGLDHFQTGAKMTDDGLLLEGAETEDPVGAFQLHLEFRLPFMPYAAGQGRANSGVYVQRRYEVQILDSFGLEGAANQCGGLYRQTPPDVNMCLPPLSWQTYDIFFYPAWWNDRGEKVADARITVLHNGVPIHSAQRLPTKTGNGRPESAEPLPILLQNHGAPVRFRNIWIAPLEEAPRVSHATAEFAEERRG